jgi:hypothetical protein
MTSVVDINDNTSMKICPTISPFVIEGNTPTSYTNSPCDDASLLRSYSPHLTSMEKGFSPYD